MPDYSLTLAPKGAALVEVDAEYTGHLPGAEMVCALFPHSTAAVDVRSAQLPCPSAAKEKRSAITTDVVQFTDPATVVGEGAGSGGPLVSTGAEVYPQLAFASDSSVNVSLLSCTLPKKLAKECGSILSDFLVRNPPSFAGTASG
jgi:hypothetical protein